MAELNSRQLEAVKYIDGPLLVLAGAGSGKTRVITQKILYLVRECGIAARNIAAVTFTNKAAREMKARVGADLSKKESRGLKVSTFHHLGLTIIRKECKELGFKPGFTIYDAQDSTDVIKELMSARYNGDDNFETIQQHISRWKNAAIDPHEVVLAADADVISIAASVIYDDYDQTLKSYNAVDFDDLIRLPVRLFENNPEALTRWQHQIRYLLIDEYQDTNGSQYRLVKLLAGSIGAFTVVGDDDQSIYAWRGAQPENLALLNDDYPRLKVIKLEQNYRSTACILQAANKLIANNAHIFEKELWSHLGFGERITVLEARNEEHEVERVVTRILAHKFQNAANFSDYAILYRGNHQSRMFERTLREHQVPYTITGSKSFFSYTEIKDIIAYLQLLCNNDNDRAFLRVINTPRREIGPATLTQLSEYANKRSVSLCEAAYELGLAEYLPDRAVAKLRHFVEWLAMMSDRAERGNTDSLVRDLIAEINYESWLQDSCSTMASIERKLENINELVQWIERLMNNDERSDEFADIISYLQLMDIMERQDKDEDSDSVNLLTLHSSKGLEFPHVYIIGMEEKLIPHHASMDDNIEEERRLAYVGITRAQKTLTFSLVQRRKRSGEMEECEPSRFLFEIPEEHLNWERIGGEVDPEKRQQKGRAHLDSLRNMLGEPIT